MGGGEAPPHFVDEAVFAYYFSLFWVIFGNILKKMLKMIVLTSFCSGNGPISKFFGYFVQQELDQPRVRQISRKCSKKRPAKMGREAPHFVDEAVLLHFALFWGNSW